jgi:predicted RNA binding protein YcfA (HicA-like mRNA interferase family)
VSSLPVLTARQLIRALRLLGFEEIRARGSHRRLVHPDGRKTTVPVHKGRDLPRGLLAKIVEADLGIAMDEFLSVL